jgi:hypothetical protein
VLRAVPLWQAAQGSFENRMGADRWASMLQHLNAVLASVPEE